MKTSDSIKCKAFLVDDTEDDDEITIINDAFVDFVEIHKFLF